MTRSRSLEGVKGRCFGIWLRRSTEVALGILAEVEGGKGHAVRRAVHLLALVREQQCKGAERVVVDVESMDVSAPEDSVDFDGLVRRSGG